MAYMAMRISNHGPIWERADNVIAYIVLACVALARIACSLRAVLCSPKERASCTYTVVAHIGPLGMPYGALAHVLMAHTQ